MKVLFRVDASLEMGSGHVMRCLTLANQLSNNGMECHFVCRAHPGNLSDLIQQSSHRVHLLDGESTHNREPSEGRLAHEDWLGCDWQTDAEQTEKIAAMLKPDWLIIDHYAIDFRWEEQVRAHCGRTLIIDDLADRDHNCELLLDQTFGREASAYEARVPTKCKLLLGSKFALLRPEFAEYRSQSLARRTEGKIRRLLITMGGVDKDNITGKVLASLNGSTLHAECEITIVMGATAPHVETVKALAAKLPWPTSVQTNVMNMAELMVEADLAIGAAGSSSWERCCLGLPTIMLVLAENQETIAEALEAEGAVVGLRSWDKGGFDAALCHQIAELVSDEGRVLSIGRKAASVADGGGVHLVTNCLLEG